jgi:oligopeptide/dipeptide ABC transporter ATP-binding protein
MIALALAPKPKLIIADEPTTALDVTIEAQILDLMKSIKNQMGTSFILITHNMSVVAGYCDRVLVMYSGRVVEMAPVHSLFKKPSHPYTQGLLQSIPRLDMPTDHPLLPIPGSPPALTEPIKGCAFCNRCSHTMPICKIEDPKLKSLNRSHVFACWRNNETSD